MPPQNASCNPPVERADHVGFHGLSSCALVKAACHPSNFAAGGFCVRSVQTLPVKKVNYTVQPNSPVVCFESAAPSADGLHSAVQLLDGAGCFPPNTLFRLKSVAPRFVAPDGTLVEQTLYTVTATFRPQRTLPAGSSSKLCGSGKALIYEDRSAYVRGLADLCRRPVLSMAQEFQRNGSQAHATWRDWAGVSYSLSDCWQYVNGPAASLRGCTAGDRDVGNDRKTPCDFMREVNAMIRRRRLWQAGWVRLRLQVGVGGGPVRVAATCRYAAAEEEEEAAVVVARASEQEDEVVAVGGNAGGQQSTAKLLLSEDLALLTFEEVLALRLCESTQRSCVKPRAALTFAPACRPCPRLALVTLTPARVSVFTTRAPCSPRTDTGPAFQPINAFLRQLSTLVEPFRSELARHPSLTFISTVTHITGAIRKIAAVASPAEVATPLYRGVRGVLPAAFFTADAAGLVCATDAAFMSTSRRRATPVQYMGAAENVLWSLQPGAESDSGFHSGADVSLLSQFAAEEETLFPPLTLLVVQPKRRPAAASASIAAADAAAPPMLRRIASSQKQELDVADCVELDANGVWRKFVSVGCVPSFV